MLSLKNYKTETISRESDWEKTAAISTESWYETERTVSDKSADTDTESDMCS